MVSTLMVMLVMQVQPNANVARAVSPPTNFATTAQLSRKDRTLTEGRALVARAERFNAGYAPGPGQPSKAELDAAIDQAKSDLDSMSEMGEMGEMESLRLQMAMDRMSKMMSTLSNLLKKASETQEGIIQNIK